jgi:hypothetical protein
MDKISKKELEAKMRRGATVRHADNKKLYKGDNPAPSKADLAPLLDKEALKDLNTINETAGKRIDAALAVAEMKDGQTHELMKQITEMLEKTSKRVPYEFEIIRDDKGNLKKVKATPVEVS